MKRSRVVLAIGSFAVALVFLLLDLFDVNLMLGQTRVAIYPVALFALIGIVLLVRPLLDRRPQHDRTMKPNH